MGIQKKHGKGRLDKWYRLAKEKGYRARAAFKLIQLNRRYKFLEKSKVLVDLCAAPGSWCQVAAETMPANSLIIGVDLAPIRPIPRTITFQSDITTDACRATLQTHLKTWKVETVLHDGAPNVGTAWVQDAFSQAELVLQALRLATELLDEGGTFVTKVFRSKDYNPLLWVFKQLFNRVEATKPPSSRNVSAEIFVVCRGFKAPKRLDPKLLDPRSVFAELADLNIDNEAKVFNPERKKRKRGGYEEGEYIQFKEAPASDFIQATDPISMLASLSRLTFQRENGRDIDLEAVSRSPTTTAEIRQCCDDLRVLGRKEFRLLLRWRLHLREKLGFANDSHPTIFADDNELVEVAQLDDELTLQQELQSLSEARSARKKREKRRDNERKQREIVRMQLHMLAPNDIGLEQNGPNGEDQLFATSTLKQSLQDGFGHRNEYPSHIAGVIPRTKSRFSIEKSYEVEQDELNDDDHEGSDGDRLDVELDLMYHQFLARRADSDMQYRAKRAKEEHDGDWEGISEHGMSDGERNCSDSGSSDIDGLSTTLQEQIDIERQVSAPLTTRAFVFFDQEGMKDIVGDMSSAIQDHTANGNKCARFLSGSSFDPGDHRRATTCSPDSVVSETSDSPHNNSNVAAPNIISGYNEDENTSPNRNIFTTHAAQDEKLISDIGCDKLWPESQPNVDIITVEAMTLAHEIVSGRKRTGNVVDEGFNKYAFKDRDGLPDWFLDDEVKHSKPHRPITAAAASAIKEKLRALNARPIKKVREAKDRKKYKMAQKLEKLRKKSAVLADEEGMTEKDKARSIATMMSKAVKKKPKQQVKVVVARGSNRGISGRPRGVKGKYKLVDARLKKDTRAEKRILKKR